MSFTKLPGKDLTALIIKRVRSVETLFIGVVYQKGSPGGKRLPVTD
jgi:hypothetical protein